MAAATRFRTQIVGALPVIDHYLERLGLAQIVDELVPWDGDVPLGTLVEILVTNRLLNPKAMFRIDAWAHKTGLDTRYRLQPGQLNDDRLGRALERLPVHAERVQAGLVVQAVKKFQLQVSQIHYDITSIELFGAYAVETQGGPPPTPLPTYGRTKSGRKNVKQVQLGMNVTGDGGVPVAHAALDGNTAESTTHLDNLRRLRTLLPKKWELYIADTKLDTPENLLAVAESNGKFLCGGAFTVDLQDRFLRQRKQLRPVDYYPKSQERLLPEQRDQYQAFEVPERLEEEPKGRKRKLDYRLLFVWSEAKQRQEAATRERHVAKIQEEFQAVERNLNKYTLKTEAVVTRRLEAARAKYTEGKLFTYQVTKQRSGTLQLHWDIDAKALEKAKLLEGVFVLKTNLPKKRCPLKRVLRKYKEQSQVERRIHHLKGPLAVTPMFLEKPERIAGLLCIVVWALMVLALMERQVRRSLKGKPLYGLYPENRPSPAPTGPALLDCFSTLCIVIVKQGGTTQRRLSQPDEVQSKLLLLLGIPPDALKTFKRRCGM
jgi:transposase